MDMRRRGFLQLIGLAGLSIPASSLAFNPFDSRLNILKKFKDNNDVSFICSSVDDYLFYTKYCHDNFEIMTFDDWNKKCLGIVVYFEKIEVNKFDGVDNFQPVKLIKIDIDLVYKWIEENKIDDKKFRTMVFMSTDEATKKRMEDIRDDFYESQSNGINLKDVVIKRHQGSSDIYANELDKKQRSKRTDK